MFKDRHEDPAIVEYRAEFCKRWSHYLSHMVTYNKNGNKDRNLTGVDLANGKKQIILITHDESIFYKHDWQKKNWQHAETVTSQPKGNGQSIMVSEFLTTE